MHDVRIDDLVPYERNSVLFEDLPPDELEGLKQSIQDHGVIEPIVITPDNRIICGHQRVRAAIELGYITIPAITRAVETEGEFEQLCIEENVRRRHLAPSQFNALVKRLYELHGIDKAGGRPTDDNRATVARLAGSLGVSMRTVKRARTLAELIPAFAKLLDEKKLPQAVALQIAQLDDKAQETFFTVWNEYAENITADEAKRIKDSYGKQIASINKELEEAEAARDALEARITEMESGATDIETLATEPVDIETMRANLEAEYETRIERLQEEADKARAELEAEVKSAVSSKSAETPEIFGPAAGEWRTSNAPRDGRAVLAKWASGEMSVSMWDKHHTSWDTGGEDEPWAWAEIYEPRNLT